MPCPYRQKTDQKKRVKTSLTFSQQPFWERSPLYKSNDYVMKKRHWNLRLTLQRRDKFLKERMNKQLMQVQIIGPSGMDSHHQWSTRYRITSSQQQISHWMVFQENNSNTCMSLLADLLSFVYMTLQYSCHKCFKDL